MKSKEIQRKLIELKEMLIEDGYKECNIVMKTLIEIIDELTDREIELRDAYLKGYEDKTNYSDKLVVDRYELAERYAVNQNKEDE